MQINNDGVEIEVAQDMEVYGDWIRFAADDGVIVKIPPFIVKKLMAFAIEHADEFPKTAWDEDYDGGLDLPDFSHINRKAVLQELVPEIEKMFGLKYKPQEMKDD